MLGSTISTRCLSKLVGMGVITGGLLFAVPNSATAQGVSGPPAVFQLEGDTTALNVCFLTAANGGPATAVPGTPNTNGLDANGCPKVSNVGSSSSQVNATWNLIQWPATSDDWSTFNFSGGAFTAKGHSLFTPAFVQDSVNSQTDDTFLGASSKDTQDISIWNWNPHGTQDKDDIEQAGAAGYKLSNNHTAIVAFMDRFGDSGDSTAGFWFVQDSTFALCTGNGTAAGPNGNVQNAACKATGTFVGQHFDGDLLIVSDFSTGGAVSTINIFKWSGNGTAGSLTGPVATLSPAPCNPVSGDSGFCGAVSNAFTQQSVTKRGTTTYFLSPTTVASDGWSYSCKNCNVSNQYFAGDFLEIGVDLNAIFGDNIPCFSTFFSETRSSTSSTASLSDLTRPVSFPFCSMNAGGACSATQIVNGGSQFQQSFTITVTNTGTATIYSPTLTSVTLPTGNLVAAASCPASAPVGYTYYPSGTAGDGCLAVTSFSPTSIANNGTSSIAGTYLTTSQYSSTTNVSATATASSSSTGTPQNIGPETAKSEQSACAASVQGNLNLNKKCDTCLQTASITGGGTVLAVEVNEGVQYCNDATTDVTINSITIQDCRGTFTTLSAGQSCPQGASQSGSYCCSVPFVTLGSNLSLAAASGGVATCNTVSAQTNPGSLASCDAVSGNCSFMDTVIATGSGLGGLGAVAASPKSASCSLCPINTTCAAITF